MAGRHIIDLPKLTTIDDGVTFVANTEYETARVGMESIVDMVKKSLGYLEKPLVKCRHCGQWGAAYCSCRHCGAPIDPE